MEIDEESRFTTKSIVSPSLDKIEPATYPMDEDYGEMGSCGETSIKETEGIIRDSSEEMTLPNAQCDTEKELIVYDHSENITLTNTQGENTTLKNTQGDVEKEKHFESETACTEEIGDTVAVIDNDLVNKQYAVNYKRLSTSDLPVQLTGAWREFEQRPDNFLKGCKWSPDGSCLLTNSDDNSLRIFNLPSELYTIGADSSQLTEMSAVLHMQEGETVYDYCWYPYMTSMDPATCCLLSSCRDHPIHMWDAFTGKLRCSYKAFDNMDEITSATSVSFNLDGSKIYSGFNKMVRVFDTNRPGRECEERPTVVKKNGQSGLISCIAFCPDHSGLYALGSYSKSVGIYSDSDGELLCLLQGQVGGVTHVLFSPDGSKLYSGGRKDEEILCWDIRNPGVILCRLVRSVTTNQRIYFDLDMSGRYLVSGGGNGTVTCWDTLAPPITDDVSPDPLLPQLVSFMAHGDCVNGVSFHPTLPLLASTSGQRRFSDIDDDSSDEECTDKNKHLSQDFSVRIWSL